MDDLASSTVPGTKQEASQATSYHNIKVFDQSFTSFPRISSSLSSTCSTLFSADIISLILAKHNPMMDSFHYARRPGLR